MLKVASLPTFKDLLAGGKLTAACLVNIKGDVPLELPTPNCAAVNLESGSSLLLVVAAVGVNGGSCVSHSVSLLKSNP